MKKICFIDYDMTCMGGIESVLAALANEFVNKYEVHIISLTSKNEFCAYTINEKITYKTIFSGDERIRKVILSGTKKVRKYINANNIDVVLMLGHYAAFCTVGARMFTRAKYVFCDHGALMNQWNEKAPTIMRFVASKMSNKIITLTERTLNDYKKHFHINDRKIDCIYNWIDNNISGDNQYKDDSKLIVSAGRFGKEKGYDMAIEVAKRVFCKHNDWEWHIYGDGETFQNIKKQIIDNNLQNNVILKGKVNNLNQLYKNYSMLVLPSYREGLPLVLLEAKVNKLPIVSFDIQTGPREIINDGKDGFLVQSYNIELMSDKIIELIEKKDLRKSFSNNSQENLYKFQKDTIAEKWYKLIDSL